LTVGMSFMALATWLLFHAAMRAQIACIQLRTRKVRVPVPTQRQLDGSRKLLSTWEEQNMYDMFRIPFVMPNGANSPEASDEEDESPTRGKGYKHGGIPGVAAKVKAKLHQKHEAGATSTEAHMPALPPAIPLGTRRNSRSGRSRRRTPRADTARTANPSLTSTSSSCATRRRIGGVARPTCASASSSA